MGAQPADCMLVAPDGWNTAGAQGAGLRSGFVARGRPAEVRAGAPPERDVPDPLALPDRLGA
ncbi:hypothetical protein ABXN37_28735 [Piscinibacter sakaiensis]|uniref:Uncharacterized protein n=1 Tax=Piscinibacter sakaiensis TaxID=1547922 RepID=A0A0K8P8Q9_PISS1|nr:hypothetical protein ISF6_0560 [Piscinibacter sakaiensis]